MQLKQQLIVIRLLKLVTFYFKYAPYLFHLENETRIINDLLF